MLVFAHGFTLSHRACFLLVYWSLTLKPPGGLLGSGRVPAIWVGFRLEPSVGWGVPSGRFALGKGVGAGCQAVSQAPECRGPASALRTSLLPGVFFRFCREEPPTFCLRIWKPRPSEEEAGKGVRVSPSKWWFHRQTCTQCPLFSLTPHSCPLLGP